MKIKALEQERIADFTAYCRKYKSEVDESFLYDEDLDNFKIDDENPTYIIIDEQDEIKAAASLMIDDYNRRGKKARFRIFHSELDDIAYYEMLLKAILQHTDGLEKVYLFVPLENKQLAKAVEELSFVIERYCYLLVRDDLPVGEFEISEEYELRAFVPGQDEEDWCHVRNISFATLKGSETPATPENIAKLTTSDEYIDGGMLMLYHKGRPVGVVRGSKDEYNNMPIMNIGPLAIIPEYQGKGLGRSLLRASISFAKQHGYDRTILSVNAENDRAKVLYLQEGFVQDEAVACYELKLNK
jgi:mycothiol synthase